MDLPEQPAASQHKDTLLRALEQIEKAEDEGGTLDYIVVGYQVDCKDDEGTVRLGWLSSGMEDRWVIAAFFTRLAEYVGRRS